MDLKKGKLINHGYSVRQTWIDFNVFLIDHNFRRGLKYNNSACFEKNQRQLKIYSHIFIMFLFDRAIEVGDTIFVHK